ncbi:MAG: Cof-type HAD-IIB family hydrolase [Bacteroidales bacterium]|nr:Cof-type HAD-IIB family hydrolase [Bacteroidales bacterium]
MIRAIFFDIDGTLLSFNTHQVSQGTIQAFGALRQQGILTFVSTGRPVPLIPSMPVEFNGYVTVNGGYCFMGDDVVVDKPLSQQDIDGWLDYVDRNNLVTMQFGSREMHVNQLANNIENLQAQLGFIMPPPLSTKEMRSKRTYQFIAMMPADKDAEVLSLLPHCRLPRWHPAFSDLIPADSSKAEGIVCIAKRLGLKKEELMAFGDGGNDMEMLDFVGIGVAMGNANETVKKHADFVTRSCDEEGIQYALTKLKII